jgi:hypothetical protein
MAKSERIITSVSSSITQKYPFPASTPPEIHSTIVPKSQIPQSPTPMFLDLRHTELVSLEFDNLDLDEIVKDNVTEHCLYRIDPDGCYMIGFLPHFAWWLEIAEQLADCLKCREGETTTTPELLEFKRVLLDLESGVSSRFPAAHLAEPTFLEYSSTPKLELLKAYRALTRFLSETAKGFWPNEDLHWLIYHA